MDRELGSDPVQVEIYGGPMDGMKAWIIASRQEGDTIIDTLQLASGEVIETAREAIVRDDGFPRELGS